MICRRAFLKASVFVIQGILFPWQVLRKRNVPEIRPFYVAGVRFHLMRQIPKASDRVWIKRERWQGITCFGIYIGNGERIGYVPRKLVPHFNALYDKNWRLASVNYKTVPWKRFKIELYSG